MRQNYQISEQFPSSEEEEALKFPLFARKKYWLLHVAEKQLVPILIRNSQNQVVGFWCFYCNEMELSTPFRAPYFTYYVSEREVEAAVFSQVVTYCKRKYELPVSLTILSQPFLYRMHNLERQCVVSKVEVGTRLEVSDDTFSSKIRRRRKRQRLRSLLLNDAFEVSEVPNKKWDKVYRQNIKWRRAKGHQSYIRYEQMNEAKNTFPKSYQALQLKHNGEVVGTCFFVLVDLNLIYVYSLITAPEIDTLEPSLLLWKAVYDYANSINVSTIDMGTSMLSSGRINKDLLAYKINIGGEVYRKYTILC